MKTTISTMLFGVLLGALLAVFAMSNLGCTQAQANAVAQDIKVSQNVIQITDESLNAANTIVGVAAPGSKVAAQLQKITTTATKVNGVVQNVQITIPVEQVAPPAPQTPAPSTATPAPTGMNDDEGCIWLAGGAQENTFWTGAHVSGEKDGAPTAFSNSELGLCKDGSVRWRSTEPVKDEAKALKF